MEKEFIIDDADFDTGHSYDDVETKPILTPHSGDDGIIDTQSSGIYREQHNNPPGNDQLSIKRKSSGEKYMSQLKKQQQIQKSQFESSHKRYKSELNEVKKTPPSDMRYPLKPGSIGPNVQEKGQSQLKHGYKKMHHYSQSITGAPGCFNPNQLKKPETSLGGGMASAISKYKKFMLTNSGESSLKQSPRVLKGETGSNKHPSGKLNPYFPARSPDITTPPSDNSSVSKPLQTKSAQIPRVEKAIIESSNKQKSGAFIYFKENQHKDTTPKAREVGDKGQKTPLLYKKDKLKGEKDIRSKKQMEMFQQKTGEESPTSRPDKKDSCSVNMDPLPSQMTLSEYAGVENMTPRTTARLKLIKLVRLSFATYSRPPKTTSDFYRVGKILGKGAFGKVNLAIHKLSQKMVALKSINKNYLSEEKQMKKKIMHEVNIIKVLRHKHIVK